MPSNRSFGPLTPITTRRTSSGASARPGGRTTTTRPTTTLSSTGHKHWLCSRVDLEAGHGHGHAELRAAHAGHRLLRRGLLHDRRPELPNDNDSTALGDVDLAQALTESSDTYFYSVGGQFYVDYDYGKDLKGTDPLQSTASQYGLGHFSGIDLPGEAPRPRARCPGH